MSPEAWFMELPAAVTVCDTQGVILWMNERSIQQFAKDGGAALIGKNLMGCHTPRSREILARLLAEGKSNCYTIEKSGQKKMVYQAPWYEGGKLGGLVEIAFEIPEEMPHHVRA